VAHLVQAHNQCHVESITINMCEPSTVKTQHSFILAERLWKYYFNRGTIDNSAITASCHMSQTFMIKMCPQALINVQYSTVFGRYLQNADSVVWISAWHESVGQWLFTVSKYLSHSHYRHLISNVI